MSKNKKRLTVSKEILTESIIKNEIAPIESKTNTEDCNSEEVVNNESVSPNQETEEFVERIEAHVEEGQVELTEENIEKVIVNNESNQETEEVTAATVPVVTEKSKKRKTAEKKVKLADTSYHYFRNFVKGLLKSNGVGSARFVKNDSGWNGHIAVNMEQKAMAKEVLAKYKIDNPDVKDLWW